MFQNRGFFISCWGFGPTRHAYARHVMTGRNFAQLRIDMRTLFDREWTTSAETAT